VRCSFRSRAGRRLRGKGATKEELLAEDRAAFRPLPAAPFDACRKRGTIANSLSLVRFGDLRARLEEEHGGAGTREYIRVLRLLETHSEAALARAVEHGLRLGALSRDAIALFLRPAEEERPAPSFHLDGREALRGVRVAQTDLAGYAALLAGGGTR